MVTITQTETFSTSQLEKQTQQYQVVHQNERRIRLLVSRLVDPVYAERLKYLVESLDYVTEVRINRAAKSIAVEFDYQVDVEKIAIAQQQLFLAIEQGLNVEIQASIAPVQEINYWQRIGLPVTTLGLAILATPIEVSIPFLVMGGFMVGAAMPIFHRAIASIVDEGKCKVDVLDSLWITLNTLSGEYVAPALMLSLLESGEAVRDVTASANQQATFVAQDENHAALVTHFLQTPTANTKVGDYVLDVSDKLVVPTLFLSGSIFALTGNINSALAPLQLDFGTGIQIALPTTILTALTSLAHAGVFIRNGLTLEILARTDTMIVDHTVTLTAATATALQKHLIQVYQQSDQEVSRLNNQNKTVAYVGNLTNTEILTYADISVSFTHKTDLQEETSDIIIVGNDWQSLILAINIAKQTMEIVYQNIALVAIPNISVVIAGVFFGLHPVAAVLINNCAALLAEFRGKEFLNS